MHTNSGAIRKIKGVSVAQSESRVFLSYVREDQKIVDRFRVELMNAGISVWVDRYNIDAGIRWEQAIRHAIESGAFFIACFSEAYHRRRITYMNEEITVAIDVLRQVPSERAWFIPVKLSPVEVPDRDIGAGETLRSLQHVNLFGNWEEGVCRVLAAVRPLPNWLISLQEKLGSKSRLERLAAI